MSYQLLISAFVIVECTYVYSLVVLLKPCLKLLVQAKHKKKRQWNMKVKGEIEKHCMAYINLTMQTTLSLVAWMRAEWYLQILTSFAQKFFTCAVMYITVKINYNAKLCCRILYLMILGQSLKEPGKENRWRNLNNGYKTRKREADDKESKYYIMNLLLLRSFVFNFLLESQTKEWF